MPVKYHFRSSIYFALGLLAIIWLVKLWEITLDVQLVQYGIYPRTLTGSIGILTGPLIHADFKHLLSNSFPLIFLMISVFYFYRRIALPVFIGIYLITGFWVWLTARPAYHIGASGLLYGLTAFLFFSGLFRREVKSMAIAGAILVLYQGMFAGILPLEDGISWESHLLGSFAGIFLALYFRNSPGPAQLEEESPVESQDGRHASSTSEHFNYSDSGNFRYQYRPNSNDDVEHHDSE